MSDRNGEGLVKSKKLINDFIGDLLCGDIKKLDNFSFLNLNTNEKYHQFEVKPKYIYKYGSYNKIGAKFVPHSYKYEDYDDMNIVRAINYVLYHDRLPNLKWDDFEWEFNSFDDLKPRDYRGDTINSFHTLINEDLYKTYFEDVKSVPNIIEMIDKFLYFAFSIGNFMLLPNIFIGNQTLNMYRGCYLGDYFDLFLNHLKNGTNDKINEYIKINKGICDLSDFDKFIKGNYLDCYVNNGEIDFYLSDHLKQRYSNSYDKEEYAKFVKEYIEKASDKIRTRAVTIRKELSEKLNS